MFHKTARPPERRSRDATAEGVLPRKQNNKSSKRTIVFERE